MSIESQKPPGHQAKRCRVRGHYKRDTLYNCSSYLLLNFSFFFRSDPWISQETLAVYEDRRTSRPNPETAGGVRGCKWRSQRRFEQQTVVTASGWPESEQREICPVPQPQEPSKALQTVKTKLYKITLLPEIWRCVRLW